MPVGGPSFSSVRKAREALKARANEILDGYLLLIKQAAAAGDFETAAKAYQHLLDRMPDEDGESILNVSVDKKQVEVAAGPVGPAVQIGIILGGTGLKLEAPKVQVIEIKKDDPTS